MVKNRVLVHQRKTRTSDGQGGWIESYGDLSTVRGNLREASAREREAARRIETEITHVLEVDHHVRIVPKDRFVTVVGGQSSMVFVSPRMGTFAEALVLDVVSVRQPGGMDIFVDCRSVQRGG